MDVLNKKSYRAFRTRCQGAGVLEVHARERKQKGKLQILYNARDPRGGKMIEGVWTILSKGQSEADLASKVQEFYDMAQQDFAVTVHRDGKVVKLEEAEEEK